MNHQYVNFEQLDRVIDESLETDADHEWKYYPEENHVFANRATWERILEKVDMAFETHLR